MSEWPKRHWERRGGDVVHTNVIPADLGRELYEALYAARAAGEDCYRRIQSRKTNDALVRYEREVKDD